MLGAQVIITLQDTSLLSLTFAIEIINLKKKMKEETGIH